MRFWRVIVKALLIFTANPLQMHRLFLSLLIFVFTKSPAQLFSKDNYSKSYFTRPLNIPVSLAGNFGDLRSNHYHMGLDFRTQQRENIAVVAAAEGYISHIKVEPYGYGRAIYITHPNGLVTLYAHLNSFFSALENYVRTKQYADKKWQQDFDLPPGQFPVKKGQFIAYSGNTGSSEGPHLHFEIRDAKTEHNYNPLLFGLGIADNVTPAIYRLAIYNRNQSVYAGDPGFVKIRKKKSGRKIINNEYETLDSVIKVPAGKFSFGISAEDKTNESFMFGIYRAELYVDSILSCAFSMNDFSYDDSRYINAGIDYSTRYSGGPYIHHLAQLPGNHIGIFDEEAGNGTLQLNDDTIHTIEILVTDVTGNSTRLLFRIQKDSLDLWDNEVRDEGAIKMEPNKNGKFEREAFAVSLHELSLYDTVYTRYTNQQKQLPYISAIHSIGNYLVPVHDSVEVSIKARDNMPDSVKQKTVMVIRSGRKVDVQKGLWKGNWMQAKWWNFGDFYLWQDTVKPKLVPVNVYDSAVFIKDRKLVFNASDEIGGLQLFEGFIDNEWIVFRQKNTTYTYDFDERCTPGWHSLRVVATDVAGNVKEYSCSFHNGIVPKPEPVDDEQ